MYTELEAITNHKYFSKSEELLTLIVDAQSSATEPPEDSIYYLERLAAINRFIKQRIDHVDPLLLPVSQLDAFESLVNLQIDSLNQFIRQVNTPPNQAFGRPSPTKFLTHANNSADQAIAQLGTVPYPSDSLDLDFARENIIALRRSVGQHSRLVNEEFSTIRKDVLEASKQMSVVSAEVTKQKERVDRIVTDYQEQFSTAEDARREAFNSAEEARSSNFKDSEKSRQTDFISAFRDKKDDFDKTLAAAIEKANSSASAIATSSADISKRLEEYKLEAQKLVGVIASTGMMHGYQSVANKEATTACWWERIAMATLGLLVAFGIYAFWLAHQENFNWHFLAARAMAVIPLGVLAGFAAHKAEQHRKIERSSRRMELELSAISPYLATLPDSIQHAVKQNLAEKFFASEDTVMNSEHSRVGDGGPLDLLKLALENMKLLVDTIAKK
jgi:hypothetical protein